MKKVNHWIKHYADVWDRDYRADYERMQEIGDYETAHQLDMSFVWDVEKRLDAMVDRGELTEDEADAIEAQL